MANKKIVKPDLAIQKDVGTKASDGTTLKNIWLELPGYCNLACSYCYAEGGKPKNIENLLSWNDYVSILEKAKAMGVEDVGIPGAGEPLLPRNKDLTFKVLEKCKDLGFYVTLFTTGEWIDEEVADRLYDLPVEVMIKGNSLKPEVQDAFVSDPSRGRNITGYGQRRNESLELLMSKGFNDEEKCQEKQGRKSRMALVTSIMDSETGPSNYAEMGEIQDYARENNIIFDVDSVLERGRGAGCELCTADQRIKSKLQELQAKDASRDPPIEWELSQSYIGTVCDRFSYHMYINQWGEVRPCIGAMDVNLGNVKENSLEESWNRQEMQIIRSRNYEGKCGDECANFSEIDEERTTEAGTPKYKCNSCLGRRTENLTNESLLEKGYVSTIGCWNHRPKE
ncbi:radical SAM protein [Candidatus Pacearchaeota archaeon]|nr:radical SAM protein [Candidatus Pacearchaeota archaeon]